MSSLALMRWLEGSPSRYDRGMRLLTFGRVGQLHVAVANAAIASSDATPGAADRTVRILEIGCGTGSVTKLLLDRGARVLAIDQSPEMLELAAGHLEGKTDDRIEFLEQTASEIDRLPRDHFSAVVLCLCLSDMSTSERNFVLRESADRLTKKGRLVVADEVRSPKGWRRILQACWRIPQAVLGWLLVGTISRPIPDLRAEIVATGLQVQKEESWLLGSLSLIVAEHES